jgi:hypothetical protein
MNIENHRHHYFDDLQFSSKEFYAMLEKTIGEYQFPNVSCSRTEFSEHGLFSAKREYLKVSWYDCEYLICAAPFGRSFFVSQWLRGTGNTLFKLIALIPFIGRWLAARLAPTTFYRIDSELLFKESVANIVDAAVRAIGETKGFRQPSEPEVIIG